jgi:hypothetical protein
MKDDISSRPGSYPCYSGGEGSTSSKTYMHARPALLQIAEIILVAFRGGEELKRAEGMIGLGPKMIDACQGLRKASGAPLVCPRYAHRAQPDA